MWFLALVLLSSAAFAQNNDQRKLHSYDFIVQQRNQAMDGMAVCVGEYGAQLEAVRKELEQAKKACEKPKE